MNTASPNNATPLARKIEERWPPLTEKIRAIEHQLVDWAFRYELFKEDLLSDPRQVVEKELAMKLPRSFEVHALEESETTRYLILPRNPYEDIGSEAQLSDLAGITLLEVAHWVLRQRNYGSLGRVEEKSNLEPQLIMKAWQDKSFKQALLNRPKAAIENELGVGLPKQLEIKILEETLESYYILLPWNKERFEVYNDHLSDHDFLVSALNKGALIDYIAANSATTATHAMSKCCCGIFTISSCF
jgi:hypothetical protein